MRAKFINGKTDSDGSLMTLTDQRNLKKYIDEGTIVNVKENGSKWFKFDGKNGQTGVTLYKWRFKLLCNFPINSNIEVL